MNYKQSFSGSNKLPGRRLAEITRVNGECKNSHAGLEALMLHPCAFGHQLRCRLGEPGNKCSAALAIGMLITLRISRLWFLA